MRFIDITTSGLDVTVELPELEEKTFKLSDTRYINIGATAIQETTITGVFVMEDGTTEFTNEDGAQPFNTEN
jgi:hypothetical protein